MLTECTVVHQHVIQCPSQLMTIATANGVITTGTANRAGIQEVTITIVTELRTELCLPHQTLQRLVDLTEVDLSIEATQQAEVLTLIGTLGPLINNRIGVSG